MGGGMGVGRGRRRWGRGDVIERKGRGGDYTVYKVGEGGGGPA